MDKASKSPVRKKTLVNTPTLGKPLVAVVTGAGKGIGRATCELLSHEGYIVVGLSRNAPDLDSLEQELLNTEHGGKHRFFKVDLTEEIQVKETFAAIRKIFGSLDVLINNAGNVVKSSFEKMSLDTWHANFSANVDTAFLCSREAIPLLKKSASGGVILNVSSLAGIRNVEKIPGFSAYSAAKSAIIGLTQAMAQELKPIGIRVNAIAPGAVQTPLLKRAAPGFSPKATPEQMAEIISFMVSNKQSQLLSSSILEVFCND